MYICAAYACVALTPLCSICLCSPDPIVQHLPSVQPLTICVTCHTCAASVFDVLLMSTMFEYIVRDNICLTYCTCYKALHLSLCVISDPLVPYVQNLSLMCSPCHQVKTLIPEYTVQHMELFAESLPMCTIRPYVQPPLTMCSTYSHVHHFP